jgi:hypothetical protein
MKVDKTLAEAKICAKGHNCLQSNRALIGMSASFLSRRATIRTSSVTVRAMNPHIGLGSYLRPSTQRTCCTTRGAQVPGSDATRPPAGAASVSGLSTGKSRRETWAAESG